MIKRTFPLISSGLTEDRQGQVVTARFAVILASLLFAYTALGQVGNDNPTGISGSFNGNVTTAGSYDPYTANVTRSITDISVDGAVGDYGLSFTRTTNSRYSVSMVRRQLGTAGNWSHNYLWHIPSPGNIVTEFGETPASIPSSFSVYYPDGRVINFSSATGDSAYRAAAGSGISDRFQPYGADGGNCYLVLPDGGKVHFVATYARGKDIPSSAGHPDGQWQWTTTIACAGIIDPHGLETLISYPNDGSMTITEPAGRCLKLFYISFNGGSVIDRVEERKDANAGTPARRTVKYNYTVFGGVTALDNAVYFGDATLTATYRYQNSNISGGVPLIWKCVDPMYAGPMWRIAYTFQPYATGVVSGQIKSENYLDAALNVGPAVSTLTVNQSTPNTRVETRGDGASRTFNYTNAKLISWTDWKGQSSYKAYDANGYVSSTKDANGFTTATAREGIIGALSVLTHFDTTTQAYTYVSRDGAPYFVQIRGDERGKNTYYTRDANNRITKIDYPGIPNGAVEQFTYNYFGQMLTHTLTSGGVATFTYDAHGLLQTVTAPATASDPNPAAHPTTYHYFATGNTDRLQYVTDSRGNSTWYEYNQRGQVTKVTYQDGTYLQSGYNPDGTLSWSADEDHPAAATDPNQRIRYTYDDYKRLLSSKNSLNKTASLSYQKWNTSSPYLHTTASVFVETSPGGKVRWYNYDDNFWRFTTRQAPGTADDASVWYGYDAVGNMTTEQDARGNITTFDFDSRNRRTSKTDPAPFSNQVRHWEYDEVGNMTKEIRPDGVFRRWEYDSMNRVVQTYGYANEGTAYHRDLAGNVTELVDAKNAVYKFEFDDQNRKTKQTYPIDATGAARAETWHYDPAGNMDSYKNPAGNTKNVTYDNRNRPDLSSWSANGPTIDTNFDGAGQLTRIATSNAGTGNDTVVEFGYDNANRQIWEEQTFAGVTRRLETPRDDDGLRVSVRVPSGGATDTYLMKYDYTQRGQLAHITESSDSTAWFQFTYDASDNLLQRWNKKGGDRLNLADSSGANKYDALNRPAMWENTDSGNVSFARDWYQYDTNDRATATWRDLPGQQASKGSSYGYDAIGQLTSAKYNADNVWTGSATNPTRTVTYTLDSLNRTGPSAVNDNNSLTAYCANALNQYTSVTGQSISYGGNFNFSSLNELAFAYNADKRLTSVSSGATVKAEFVYDGLGRCVQRVEGTTTTRFTYDGWKPIVEWDSSGVETAWNVFGAGLDEILARGGTTFGRLRYHTDRIGSVIAILNSSGSIVEKYTYDAFGAPTISNWDGTQVRTQSSVGNRFMFNGREYLASIQLYDYRNRFYVPALGKFLQADPLSFSAGDVNLFRYCGGDPVNCTDPLGLVNWGQLGHGVVNAGIGGIGLGIILGTEAPSFGAVTLGIPLAVGKLAQGFAQIAEAIQDNGSTLADSMIADPIHAIAAMGPPAVEPWVDTALAVSDMVEGGVGILENEKAGEHAFKIGSGLYDLAEKYIERHSHGGVGEHGGIGGPGQEPGNHDITTYITPGAAAHPSSPDSGSHFNVTADVPDVGSLSRDYKPEEPQ